MAIFGLLPFEGFDALQERVNQPFKGFHLLLLRLNGHDGFFEPFAQVLIGLVQLVELFVFPRQPCTQDRFLSSQLFQLFVFRHATTLADCTSSCNCKPHMNSYFCCGLLLFCPSTPVVVIQYILHNRLYIIEYGWHYSMMQHRCIQGW